MKITLLARLPFIIFISALVPLTGCQEDARGTHTPTLRASELANSRLGMARRWIT